MASDLRVTFTRKSDTVYHVKCSVQDGESATSTFIVPMPAEQMAEVVGRLSATRSNSSSPTDTTTAPPETDGGSQTTRSAEVVIPPEHRATAEDLGQKLFAALVDDDVERLFEQVTSEGGARIRLVMDADNTSLMGIPWEFLCRDGMFLAAQRDTPILREFKTENQPSRFVAPDTIKVLGVTASPNDLDPLDVDDEKQRVTDAIADYSDLIDVEWVDKCTYDQLHDALLRVQPHILHFVGHSSSEGGVAHIALCDEQGNKKNHSGTAFANLLGKSPDLRVVVLNSCEGARTGTDDPFTGLAARLIEQGRSAVVAMQFEITDRAAAKFAEKFYTALVRDRLPIDQAVATARLAVMGVNEVEFATPVLFLASSETNDVFQFQPPGQSEPAAPAPADDAPLQPLVSGPSTTRLDPGARVTPTKPTPPEPTDGSGSGFSRTLIAAGAGAAAVIIAIVVIIAATGGDDPEVASSAGALPSELALDCVDSEVFFNGDELPFDDNVFDALDAAAVICADAYVADVFTDPAADDIVGERIDRIDDALVDGEVSFDEYSALVADADEQWEIVVGSIEP